MDRQTDKETDRQTDIDMDRQTDKDMDRQTDKEMDRQTDKEMDRQTANRQQKASLTDRSGQMDRCNIYITYKLWQTYNKLYIIKSHNQYQCNVYSIQPL